VPDKQGFRIKIRVSARVVIVAIAVALVVGLAWWNHRQFCLAKAEEHRLQADVETGEANHFERLLPSKYGPRYIMDADTYRSVQRGAESHRSATVEHGRLAQQYEDAVWQPWLRLFISEPTQ
jgi:hypothetical protein